MTINSENRKKMNNIFEIRQENLKKKLRENNIKGLVVFKDENIFYLTGFYGRDTGSIAVITEKETVLLTHFIYFEHSSNSVSADNARIVMFLSQKFKKLSEELNQMDIKSCSFEGNSISYDSFLKAGEVLKENGIEVTSKSGLVEGLRIIKDEYEIEAIKKACKITLDAFELVLGESSANIRKFSEIELALEIEKNMIKNGASGRSFDFVVANNQASSLPHYDPSKKIIDLGILLFDMGCKYENYCSDFSRTIFIDGQEGFKNPEKIEKLKQIYDIVLQAQIKAVKACRAGMTCKELDHISREYIEEKGYGKCFGHGLGHGIGLDVHELPVVSFIDDTILKENMVITIEPGIYIEGIGGVRIEDIVLVKDEGCENFYGDSKSLIVLE
jgi:Xaa-Pro aminopeptidase